MLLSRSAMDVSGRHQEGSCDAAIQAACHVGAQLEGRHLVVWYPISSRGRQKRSISSLASPSAEGYLPLILNPMTLYRRSPCSLASRLPSVLRVNVDKRKLAVFVLPKTRYLIEPVPQLTLTESGFARLQFAVAPRVQIDSKIPPPKV